MTDRQIQTGFVYHYFVVHISCLLISTRIFYCNNVYSISDQSSSCCITLALQHQNMKKLVHASELVHVNNYLDAMQGVPKKPETTLNNYVVAEIRI